MIATLDRSMNPLDCSASILVLRFCFSLRFYCCSVSFFHEATDSGLSIWNYFFFKYWLQIPSKFRYQPKSLFVICVVRSCDWSSWTVGDRCSTLPLPVGCTEKALFNIDLPWNVSSLLMCGQRDRDKVCLLGHCLPHLKASCIFSSCIH